MDTTFRDMWIPTSTICYGGLYIWIATGVQILNYLVYDTITTQISLEFSPIKKTKHSNTHIGYMRCWRKITITLHVKKSDPPQCKSKVISYIPIKTNNTRIHEHSPLNGISDGENPYNRQIVNKLQNLTLGICENVF